MFVRNVQLGLCYTQFTLLEPTPQIVLSRHINGLIWHDETVFASGRAVLGVGVIICLERGADCLHMVQMMPIHPNSPIISYLN